MDPYIILSGQSKGMNRNKRNRYKLLILAVVKHEQLILVKGVDSKKGHLIYLTWKGSFQVIFYKMSRFLSGKLKKHMKLAKIAFLLTDWSFLWTLTDLVIPWQWDVCLGGVSPREGMGGRLARGCLPRGLYISRTQRQAPPPVDRQALVKTLSFRNYCCGR